MTLPRGVIKTIDEALEIAKRQPFIYRVESGTGSIEKRYLKIHDSGLGIYHDENHTNHVMLWHGSRPSSDWYNNQVVLVFANFWDAYAYSLRAKTKCS